MYRETKDSSRDYTGKAVATYPNGEIYDGEYVNGIREGKGNYTYLNGDVYEGDWKENKRDGIGRMFYGGKGENANGNYYGYWKDGSKCGEGVFTYKNQDLYSGEWKGGSKNGTGTFIFFETGMKMFGTWKDGNFVDGDWILPNGTKFVGQYDNNRPKGKGLWKFANGNEVEGDYS